MIFTIACLRNFPDADANGSIEALAKSGWREIDLASQPKGHRLKVKVAATLRTNTPMTYQWIADRLRMGSASYVSNLLTSLQ